MIDAHVHIETRPYRTDFIWEYINQACKMGIKELYLLEHSHRFKEFFQIYRHILQDDSPVGVYQREWLKRKMKRSLGEYYSLIRAMRQEVLPLKVYWGLEICYFPGEEQALQAIAAGFDWDFLTGAVHWLDGWGFDHPQTKSSWRNRDVDAIYHLYYENLKQMIGSGLFDHIAHPDSLKCFGHYPTVDLTPTYHELAQLAKHHQVKVEFNNGLYLNYFHPELGLNRSLLACLKQAGVELLTASDAHHPEDVGKYIREAEAIIKNIPSQPDEVN
jgi:histidinol-phosphatase (PHP family)